jgi:hypothetical protein
VLNAKSYSHTMTTKNLRICLSTKTDFHQINLLYSIANIISHIHTFHILISRAMRSTRAVDVAIFIIKFSLGDMFLINFSSSSCVRVFIMHTYFHISFQCLKQLYNIYLKGALKSHVMNKNKWTRVNFSLKIFTSYYCEIDPLWKTFSSHPHTKSQLKLICSFFINF